MAPQKIVSRPEGGDSHPDLPTTDFDRNG